MRDRIPINRELVPYNFEIALADDVFIIGCNYNFLGDFFTLSLNDRDGNVICRGEKLVYGSEVWENVFNQRTFPHLRVIPGNAADSEDAITWDNFGTTVFLEVWDESED